MERNDASTPSPERRLARPNEQLNRELGLQALNRCLTCGHELKLPEQESSEDVTPSAHAFAGLEAESVGTKSRSAFGKAQLARASSGARESSTRKPSITGITANPTTIKVHIAVGSSSKVVSASSKKPRATLSEVFSADIVDVLMFEKTVSGAERKKTLGKIEKQLKESKRRAYRIARVDSDVIDAGK